MMKSRARCWRWHSNWEGLRRRSNNGRWNTNILLRNTKPQKVFLRKIWQYQIKRPHFWRWRSMRWGLKIGNCSTVISSTRKIRARKVKILRICISTRWNRWRSSTKLKLKLSERRNRGRWPFLKRTWMRSVRSNRIFNINFQRLERVLSRSRWNLSKIFWLQSWTVDRHFEKYHSTNKVKPTPFIGKNSTTERR